MSQQSPSQPTVINCGSANPTSRWVWAHIPLVCVYADDGQQFVALVERRHNSGWVAVPCVWLCLLQGGFIIHTREPRRSKTNKHVAHEGEERSYARREPVCCAAKRVRFLFSGLFSVNISSQHTLHPQQPPCRAGSRSDANQDCERVLHKSELRTRCLAYKIFSVGALLPLSRTHFN